MIRQQGAPHIIFLEELFRVVIAIFAMALNTAESWLPACT